MNYFFFEEGTPVSVVINESIELAKTFGGDNSSRFIHGVLSELVKENVSPERLTPSFQSSALERKESSALERKEALRWNERKLCVGTRGVNDYQSDTGN